MKYEIKSRWNSKILFTADVASFSLAVDAALKAGANLRNADLRNADLPAPTIVLLANWEKVSDSLTADLMEYDAFNHLDRRMFDEWAKGGTCPYAKVKIQRACNFTENKQFWGKGKIDTPYNLMMRLFSESKIKR